MKFLQILLLVVLICAVLTVAEPQARKKNTQPAKKNNNQQKNNQQKNNQQNKAAADKAKADKAKADKAKADKAAADKAKADAAKKGGNNNNNKAAADKAKADKAAADKAAADAAKKGGKADAGKGAAAAGAAAGKVDANGDPPTKVAKVSTAGQNFCKQDFPNLKASDGTQNRDGDCSSTVQGAIPNVNKMVSTIILEPANAGKVPAGKAFTIKIKNQNIETGFFDDPKIHYYATPQTLNKQGIIQGHQHVTLQELGTGKTPLDPQKFQFFKGLNAPDVNGILSVDVPPEKAVKGNYRLCSITGTFGHQPVIMPVAQRGSQDDCIRFQIV
ncbi:hypothetical protein HDU97_006486 [Phlyctochytrium planicorne]|nr:hypothetical protein HDU97_006486 [Phlyctochytrium planicorne]